MPGLLPAVLPEAVGLQLLLNGNSHLSCIVARAACTAVGIAYPIYASFRAIEERRAEAAALKYWAMFGATTCVESLLPLHTLQWLPYWYHAKLLFLLWLQAPSTRGAARLYRRFVRPFLLRHQAGIDAFLGRLRGLGSSAEGAALGALWRHALALAPGLSRIYAGSDDEDEDAGAGAVGHRR